MYSTYLRAFSADLRTCEQRIYRLHPSKNSMTGFASFSAAGRGTGPSFHREMYPVHTVSCPYSSKRQASSARPTLPTASRRRTRRDRVERADPSRPAGLGAVFGPVFTQFFRSLPNISHTNGPSPTHVEYAFVTPTMSEMGAPERRAYGRVSRRGV
jgi:hypothetical protein